VIKASKPCFEGREPIHQNRVGRQQSDFSFTTHIYQLTKTYPKQEVYGLCSQLRRGTTGHAHSVIKASKPCFERRESNHQNREGWQEADKMKTT